MLDESSLSTGTIEEVPGYELYTFTVATSGFLAASQQGQAALYEALCGWYLAEERPLSADLAHVRARPTGGGGHLTITLKIRRGPQQLARAMLSKLYCDRSSEEGIFVADGDNPYIIPNDAFPSYVWPTPATVGSSEEVGRSDQASADSSD